MKLILITSPKSSQSRYELNNLGLSVLALSLVLMPIIIGVFTYRTYQYFDNPSLNKAIAENLRAQVSREKDSLLQLKEKSETRFKALTLSLAEAQSRLLRLEALGQKLVRTGNLKKDEFDFSSRVALGGLQENAEGDAFAKPKFSEEIDRLLIRLNEQEVQMTVLDSLLNNELMEKEVFLAGRPIKKGWMSSFFGKRIDPFSGKLAQHKGVDFAGKEDSEIIAVASGVVTWSGERYGYGQLVEIDHGQGYKTRYAHNKKNLVKVGDIVRKGQTLAHMGSTGRSTGPHTHFEVLKDERQINPERFVYRED